MALRFQLPPPVTRALIIATCFVTFTYILARVHLTSESSAEARSVPYLALVPSKSLYYPWTIITSTFVEQNVLNFLINTTAFYLSGRYLERAWSSKELALVAAVGATIPNLLVIPTYVIWGAIMRNTTRADTPITGAITLQAAFLVAFKQLVPEHTVSLYKGVVKIRVKHFPAIFLLLNTVSGVLFGTDTALLLAWYGLVTTWVYLRFIRYQPDLGLSADGVRLRGDASETFAFATFFPDIMQPPIAAICDQIYIFFCNIRLIRPFSDEAIASSNEYSAGRRDLSLPTSNVYAAGSRTVNKREEAERRRALALKALDERLNRVSDQTIAVPTVSETQSEPDAAHEEVQAVK